VLPQAGSQGVASNTIANASAFKAAAHRFVEGSKIANLWRGGQAGAGAARISASRIGRFTTAAIAASAMSAYHIHW
jgi:hypothetical protein